ncbi:MAG TPA: hypothetical protein PK402_12575, partial [Tepidisphaeraceae bacterium]|nr:hypothetical protein [Tepidisphaeraceae bacterium]
GLVLLFVGAVIGGFFIWISLEFRKLGDVHLSVKNESSSNVESVRIISHMGDRSFGYLSVNEVMPQCEKKAFWRMPNTMGSVALRVITPKGEMVAEAGYLLDDDGPYYFDVIVRDDEIIVDRSNNEPTATWKFPPATQPIQ